MTGCVACLIERLIVVVLGAVARGGVGGSRYARWMRVRVEVSGGADDELGQLEQWLHSDRDLDVLEVQRGRAEIGSGELGAAEVLLFVASDVMLPMAVEALYDFVRSRRRVRPADNVRLRLTRVDLPDGGRVVELEVDGSAEAAVAMVRDALR